MGLTPLERIEQLISDGRAIGMNTHRGVGVGNRSELWEEEPYRLYPEWKDKAAEFLRENGFADEYELFTDSDDMPIMVSGPELSDPSSPKVQQLNMIVRREVPKKLEKLREVRAKLKEREHKNVLLAFDPTTSVLVVKGDHIDIQKSSNQYHFLCIIFENPDLAEIGKEWHFSEINERVDENYKKGDERYYNAAYQVREKVKVAGHPDFLKITRRSAQITPQYLH